MIEQLVHALDQSIRNGMLEKLGFIVDRAPVETHDLDQEKLDQPVTAQNVRRESLAGPGQANAAVRLVLDKTTLGEGFDHRGHRARCHFQERADSAHSHQAVRVLLLAQNAL